MLKGSCCFFFSVTPVSPGHEQAFLPLRLLQGAFWGLVVGLTVGCIRMLLDFVYPAPPCYQEDTRPGVVKHVHYLYFSIILAFITLAVVVVVSLSTEEPQPEQVTLVLVVCMNCSNRKPTCVHPLTPTVSFTGASVLWRTYFPRATLLRFQEP